MLFYLELEARPGLLINVKYQLTLSMLQRTPFLSRSFMRFNRHFGLKSLIKASIPDRLLVGDCFSGFDAPSQTDIRVSFLVVSSSRYLSSRI